jgi:hypothetical protein
MRLATRILAGLALVAFCATPAFAQGGKAGAGGMSFGVGGAYLMPGGDLGDGADAGIGGEASFRYGVARNIGVLAGFGYSMHGVTGISDKLNIMRIVVAPRYTIAMASMPKLAPFVGARVQYAMGSLSTGGSKIKNSGIGFGGEAGVQYTMSPSLSLEGAVSFVSQNFGDVSVDGTKAPGTDTSGSIIGFGVGVVFKFGH